jgi:hypothetical protein
MPKVEVTADAERREYNSTTLPARLPVLVRGVCGPHFNVKQRCMCLLTDVAR